MMGPFILLPVLFLISYQLGRIAKALEDRKP